jgi:ankyrin repeat protein
MNPLYEAVRAGDAARVQAIVQADPSLAIFAAAMQGDTARLEELLAANRSLVSAVSPDGWTPLHLAAFFGGGDAARLLLNKGASPGARSTNAMANLPLHAAAAGRHTAIVKLLIEFGAPVNARQQGGWTALHAAAQNGDLELAEILVAAGAEIGARADNNQCAMDLALTKGQQRMVEFLEARGASL